MENKLFYDIETEEYITGKKLEEEFKILKEEQPKEYENVNIYQFMLNCLWQCGGTLQEIR